MYRFLVWMSLFTLVTAMVSCKSSSVTADGLIQKRKYRKGFHINFSKHRHQFITVVDKKEKVEKVVTRLDSEVVQEIERNAANVDVVISSNYTFSERKISELENSKIALVEIDESLPLLVATFPPVEDYFGEEEKSNKKADNLALASLIIGFVALILPVLGAVFGVLALTFGILGLKSEKNRWMAITGVTMGSLSLAFLLLFLGVMLI